ncbi:TonB-dependent receptor [Mucilaginibacter limnophilus]|uniref:TonB-dependent receptor n=1 Tax=Mucilaginibacter limnophilus TaxID=1932778 RepID=A0A437MVC5_9SPHI|nr:outer membrane beta-barrel protein [Mucilaginibacter limnophilus]RVU01618.1 TonB-dependent receptor [Mucilaginibacter limnophilus]
MKQLLLTAVCCLFTTYLFAQTPQNNITITGVVIDSASDKPLDFVTVALQDAKTKSPVKSTLTKGDGSFTVNAPRGQYQLVLAFIGYSNKVINLDSTKTTTDLGKIIFSASSKQLNEVQVTGVRPVMKQEVDRLSYDVQADPESKAITALDMIRKVPLLSVDGEDNIKLRGSGNYKILLNGKESALMARSPSDILKSMPASNIVKIEVITTPPAKYDAEGLAGIINIITVKKTDEGYNGSINSGYNTIWGYRANLNSTIKQGKFGLTGYVGLNKRPERSAPFTNNTDFFQSGTETVTSSISQDGSRANSFGNRYGSAELSFEADTLNLLTASFNFYNGDNTQTNNQYTILRDGTNAITQQYNLMNSGEGDNHGYDFGINYQLGFKRNKEQLLTMSYKYSSNENSQNTAISSENVMPSSRQFNEAGSKEHTTQLDYIHPSKMLTVEGGGKMINRDNFSNFNTDVQNAGGNYVTDPAQSNNFTYNQNVYAVYNSYLLKFTKWSFKGGLRFERTSISADFTSSNTNLDENFDNLVPSFSVQRSLKNSSLNFGFTQRIQRPGIWQLNPFADRRNPQYVNMGNPNLRPSVNNNFELSYGNFAKGSINISASYSFANNTIQNVTTVDNGVTTTTYANVGQNKNLALDANVNYPITEKLNVNINSELMYVRLRGTVDGEFYSNSGFQGHIFTYTSYKFNKGYRVGMNVGLDSRYVMLQGTDNYWLGYGANVSKEVLNKNGTIFFNANSPFAKYIKLDYTTRTPDFYTRSYNYAFYRSFNIGFNYKFGSLNADIKKNKRGISNDDTSSGSKN